NSQRRGTRNTAHTAYVVLNTPWRLLSPILGLALACSGTVERDPSATDGELAAPWSGEESSTGKDEPGQEPETDVVKPVDDISGPDSTNPDVGSSPLRRLSNAEYENSVKALFSGVAGVDDLVRDAVGQFPAEPESLGFRKS